MCLLDPVLPWYPSLLPLIFYRGYKKCFSVDSLLYSIRKASNVPNRLITVLICMALTDGHILLHFMMADRLPFGYKVC
jgi:hypothetical protein